MQVKGSAQIYEKINLLQKNEVLTANASKARQGAVAAAGNGQ